MIPGLAHPIQAPLGTMLVHRIENRHYEIHDVYRRGEPIGQVIGWADIDLWHAYGDGRGFLGTAQCRDRAVGLIAVWATPYTGGRA